MIVDLPDGDTLMFNVVTFATRMNARLGHGQPAENEMSYNAEKGNYRLRLQFTNISGQKENETFKLDGYDAYLLAGKKLN